MATAVSQPPALESQPAQSKPSRPINKKKAAWTDERRAALAEKMRSIQQKKREERQQELVTDADVLVAHLDTPTPAISGAPMQSPFALTDEHEFPTSPSQVDRVDIYSNPPGGTSTLIDSIPVVSSVPPALPGTPLSPYRRCPCLGVLPGRVCMFCYGTKWTKLCTRCEGEGRIHLTVRKGAERSQPCGHCGGKGTLPANQKEIAEATRLAEEFAASPANQSSLAADESETQFRRSTRLPGIGVTATKRDGRPLASRRKDRLRNENRKKKYSEGKAGQQAG